MLFCRRICPGRYLAIQSVWLAVVSVLATFKINKAKDAHGREIDFQPEFTTGLAVYVSHLVSAELNFAGSSHFFLQSHPKPFPCEIVPRSSKAEKLIHATG